MNRTWLNASFATVLALGWAAIAAAASPTATIYDGQLGTPPDAQGWFSVVPAGGATQSVFSGGVTLDTTILGNSTQSGYARAQFLGNAVTLDSSSGFALTFRTTLASEAHANDDRAGMSVIVLDNAHKGVELGFWTDRVFAQNLSGTSFMQSATERALGFDTTAPKTYSLRFEGGGYQLLADGAPLFSGQLRDYSPSGASVLGIAIYDQPNFLFFGDDTSSAAARWTLNAVSIAPVPEASQAAMMLAGLLIVGYALRRRAALNLRSLI